MANDHIINTGKDGTLIGMTPDDVKKIVDKALQAERIVLHFHGGLVNEKGGRAAAARLTATYQDAGAYPIFFVWHSGAGEIISKNLKEIMREDLFDAVLERVLDWAVGKVRGAVPGGRAGGVVRPNSNELRGELQARNPKKPETGHEPFAGLDAQPSTLTKAQEADFLADLAGDPRLRLEVASALSGRGKQWDNSSDARGVPAARPKKSSMDESVLEELADGRNDEEGARGIGIGTALAMARKALKVLKEVLGRYSAGTDSGVYCTVVDEILRAFYVSKLAGAGWQAMKKETLDSFGGEDRGAFAALKVLAAGLATDSQKPVTLVGHSTGAVFIGNLLTDVVQANQNGSRAWPAASRFQVVFLAPAATSMHFAGALAKAPNLVGRLRMFTMTPKAETEDKVLGALYPRSLLYLVSGVLERDDAKSSALIPVVGLSRYLEAGADKYAGSKAGQAAKLGAVRKFFASDPDLVVLSPNNDRRDGFKATAKKHGDFDNDAAVLSSVQHLIRTWDG